VSAHVRRLAASIALGTVVLVAPGGVAAAKPVVPGEPEIKLTTRTTDAGPHPILKWKKVRDAEQYQVVVQTPKADPYWMWRGSETRVRFGGGPLDAPKKTEGATLTRKMVWFVYALDAEGDILASSSKRKIAP
jgi:hypothetical protein